MPSGPPFRTAAEMVSATGTCARCGSQVPRADLVFAVDGTLRCRGCERPMQALAPLYRDAIPLRWTLAGTGGVVFLVLVLPWLLSFGSCFVPR